MFLGLHKVSMADPQSQMKAWCEEEDRGAVGEKVGQRWQCREDSGMDRDTVGGRHERCQTRRWKADGREKYGPNHSIPDLSEEKFGFSNIPRKKHEGKGKKKWVPKPRQSFQRREFGKLIIGDN